MPLRVMQIFLPRDSDKNLDELLEGRQILGRWRDTDTDQVVLHLLVPAEETEPIMDRCEQQFGSVEGFHVVLFPVEAVLPRLKPEPETDTEKEPETEEKEQNSKQRISREELYAEVTEGLDISRVYLGMSILSAVVAVVGLMRDDVAVIIGAMVIAPLLGPNVALSLGTTLGDVDLIRRAVITNLVGVLTAFGFAVVAGLVVTVNPDVPAIMSRTEVGLGDILLALAAGAAGTLAFTRGLAGAVIGVMVAVALMPPLVVCGMLTGAGRVNLAFGAFLLTAANVICINLAGVAVFLIQGVRPRNWWEAERAKKASRRAVLIWVAVLAALIVVLWLNQRG
jgi:uncharacterized hydrophobic protein (TIGR00341 family)